MPVSAFFPSAAPQSIPAPTTPRTHLETRLNYTPTNEPTTASPDLLEQRLRSISASHAVHTRGWKFPSSRRYLWDRTATGPCIAVDVKDLVPPVEIPHSFFAGQRWLKGKSSEKSYVHHAIAKYSTRSPNGVKITLEQEDLLNPSSCKPGYDKLERSTVACHILEGSLAMKDGLVKSLQSCALALDQKGPTSLFQLLPLVCALENASSPAVVLNGVVMVPNASFVFTPLLPKRMCDVPLARILQQPLAFNTGGLATGLAAQNGLLSMDQARSVMPLTPDDPQVYSVPLVGVWIKNAPSVQHPSVAACCFRFRYCSTFKDRALQAGGAFLVAVLTEASSSPQYYECEVKEGPTGLQLLPCWFALSKTMPPQPGAGPDVVTPVPDPSLSPIKLQSPQASSLLSPTYPTHSHLSTTAAVTSRSLPGNLASTFDSMQPTAAYTSTSQHNYSQSSPSKSQQSSGAVPAITVMSRSSDTSSMKDRTHRGSGLVDGLTPHATMVHYDMSGCGNYDNTHVQTPTTPPPAQPPAMRLEAPGGAAVSLVMPAGMPSWCVTAEVHTTLTSTSAPQESVSKHPGPAAPAQQMQTMHLQQFTWSGCPVPAVETMVSKDASGMTACDRSFVMDPAAKDVVKALKGPPASLSKDSIHDIHSYKDANPACKSSDGNASGFMHGLTGNPDDAGTMYRGAPNDTAASPAAAVNHQHLALWKPPGEEERPGLTPEANVLQGQIQELRRQVQELQQQVAAVAAANSSNPSASQSLEVPFANMASLASSYQPHGSSMCLPCHPTDPSLPLIAHSSSNINTNLNANASMHPSLHSTSWAAPATPAQHVLAAPASRPSTPQQLSNTTALQPTSYSVLQPAMPAPILQQYTLPPPQLSNPQSLQHGAPELIASKLSQQPLTQVVKPCTPTLPQQTVQTTQLPPCTLTPTSWQSPLSHHSLPNLLEDHSNGFLPTTFNTPSSMPPFSGAMTHMPNCYAPPPSHTTNGLPCFTPTSYTTSSIHGMQPHAPYPASPFLPSLPSQHSPTMMHVSNSHQLCDPAQTSMNSGFAPSQPPLTPQQQLILGQAALPPLPAPSTPQHSHPTQPHPCTPMQSTGYLASASSTSLSSMNTPRQPTSAAAQLHSQQQWTSPSPTGWQPESTPSENNSSHHGPSTPTSWSIKQPDPCTQPSMHHHNHLPPTDISSSWSASHHCSQPSWSQVHSAASTPREPGCPHQSPTFDPHHTSIPPMQEASWQSLSTTACSLPGSCSSLIQQGLSQTINMGTVAPPMRSDSPSIVHPQRDYYQAPMHTSTVQHQPPTGDTTSAPQSYSAPHTQTLSAHDNQLPSTPGQHHAPQAPLNTFSMVAYNTPGQPSGLLPTAAHTIPHQPFPHQLSVAAPPSPKQIHTSQTTDAPEPAPQRHLPLHMQGSSVAPARPGADACADDAVRTSTNSSLSSLTQSATRPGLQPLNGAIARCKELQASFASSDSSLCYNCDDDGLSLGSLSARGVDAHLGLSGLATHGVSHVADLPPGSMDIVRTKYIPISDDSDSDSEEDARLMAKYGLRH